MKEKTLKVYRQPSVEKAYPEIRLSGKWLIKSRFEIGYFSGIVCKKEVILVCGVQITRYLPDR